MPNRTIYFKQGRYEKLVELARRAGKSIAETLGRLIDSEHKQMEGK